MRARTSITIILSTLVLSVIPVAVASASSPAPTPPAARPAPAPKVQAAQVTLPPPPPPPAPPALDPHDPADFTNPLHGFHVISPFGRRSGRRHEGIDLKGPYRTTVVATFPGTVLQAGPGMSGYGNTVTIDHGQGVTTVYAHLYSWSVKRGDVVEQGDPIGAEGQTGSASTYHVHYEIRENGVPRDPAPYLKPE
ncbi:MAG: rane protein [Acidimicrobiales bacterium]|jgi:murein DD-endopeptidase MepM/ murein hydrolase activator NlpD|nr:rane protein [Acidimicrobiales bacterium]